MLPWDGINLFDLSSFFNCSWNIIRILIAEMFCIQILIILYEMRYHFSIRCANKFFPFFFQIRNFIIGYKIVSDRYRLSRDSHLFAKSFLGFRQTIPPSIIELSR